MDRINKHNKKLNVHEHGLEAYGKLFSQCKPGQLKLEATPNYIYHETPVRVLSQLDPQPTIIFILREPADRILSSYRFSRYRRKRHQLSFQEFNDPERNSLKWAFTPMEKSRYSKFLKRWLHAFDRSKIRVYLFERMKAEPKRFMQDLARDIGIDPSFYEEYDLDQRNPSRKIRFKGLHDLGEKLQPYIPLRVQEKLIPFYLKLNSGSPPPISTEEKEEKERLYKEFLSEQEALKELLPELDLSPWEKSAEKAK